MNAQIPRLRMFAGPNGSGKTTIKTVLRPELLGIYVNPDEIEKNIAQQGFLDLAAYDVTTTQDEILSFFKNSPLLIRENLLDKAQQLQFHNDKLIFSAAQINAYFASVIADFIRQKLLEANKSFTFETVMSSLDKIQLLQKAQARGYRTYLYYIATKEPAINISRVNFRVKMGQHNVPQDKIINRYERSLSLLLDAIRHTNRAYIFDNSESKEILVAEITDGKLLELKTNQLPLWFKKSVWDKLI
jgi:predicted ABC-type ATPase